MGIALSNSISGTNIIPMSMLTVSFGIVAGTRTKKPGKYTTYLPMRVLNERLMISPQDFRPNKFALIPILSIQ